MRTKSPLSYLLSVTLLLGGIACDSGGPGSASVSAGSGGVSGGDVGGGAGIGGSVSGGEGGGTGDTPDASTPDSSGPPADNSGSGGGGDGGTSTPRYDVSVSPGGDSRATANFTGTSDSNGFAFLGLTVSDATSVQLLTTTSGTVATLAFTAPSGTVLLDATDNSPPRTYALAFDTLVNSLPYPTRSADTALSNGAYIQTLGFTQGQQDFSGSVVAKNDSSLSRGTIRVTIFLVGDEAQRSSTRTALNAAVAIWQTIYSSLSAGVTLQVQFKDVSSNTGIVPNPTSGSDLFLSATSEFDVPAYTVPVFVGEDISADGSTTPGSGAGLLGVSSGIPGPALPTRKSGVAISLLNHAGSDGVFSGADIGLLGETLAHEVGHYLGLIHPVECQDRTCATFIEGDSLSDTPTCSTTQACINNTVASNLMFPVPVSGQSQRNVTSQQGGVVNLQVLVD